MHTRPSMPFSCSFDSTDARILRLCGVGWGLQSAHGPHHRARADAAPTALHCEQHRGEALACCMRREGGRGARPGGCGTGALYANMTRSSWSRSAGAGRSSSSLPLSACHVKPVNGELLSSTCGQARQGKGREGVVRLFGAAGGNQMQAHACGEASREGCGAPQAEDTHPLPVHEMTACMHACHRTGNRNHNRKELQRTCAACAVTGALEYAQRAAINTVRPCNQSDQICRPSAPTCTHARMRTAK